MKRFKYILIAILCCFFAQGSVHAMTNQQVMQDGDQETAAKISERNGVLLDVARCPMTRQDIENVIDQMNPQKFSYLVLHLNDDEHVAFQSKLLGNVGAPNTLSTADLKAITQDAQKHHIMLVPDFDTPGHCKALLKLLNQNDPKLARKVQMDDNTLDYTSNQTIKFVKEIDGELNQACGDQKYPYLMMGGDEVAGGGTHNKALMRYFNKLNVYENQAGFRSIIWNDSVMKHNDLSDKITIAYWAQAGANTASGLLQKYFDDRATVADLVHHPLINANETYNYLNLSDLGNATFVKNFIDQFNQNDPQNFNLINNQTWTNNPDSYQKEVATDGQLICLWGDKDSKVDMTQLIQFFKNLDTPLPTKSSSVSKISKQSVASSASQSSSVKSSSSSISKKSLLSSSSQSSGENLVSSSSLKASSSVIKGSESHSVLAKSSRSIMMDSSATSLVLNEPSSSQIIPSSQLVQESSTMKMDHTDNAPLVASESCRANSAVASNASKIVVGSTKDLTNQSGGFKPETEATREDNQNESRLDENQESLQPDSNQNGNTVSSMLGNSHSENGSSALGLKTSYQIPSSTINSVASVKTEMNSSHVLPNESSENSQVKKTSSSSQIRSKKNSNRTSKKGEVIPQTGEKNSDEIIGLGILGVLVGLFIYYKSKII